MTNLNSPDSSQAVQSSSCEGSPVFVRQHDSFSSYKPRHSSNNNSNHNNSNHNNNNNNNNNFGESVFRSKSINQSKSFNKVMADVLGSSQSEL